jgi:hypothetical protein
MSAALLKAETEHLGQPIYWAGSVKGYSYEFSRTSNGAVYVRYLPRGVRAGARGAEFLIVAAYRFPGAYAGLKRVAGSRAIAGPGGSIIFVRPTDPRPAVAMAVAESGKVRPVG